MPCASFMYGANPHFYNGWWEVKSACTFPLSTVFYTVELCVTLWASTACPQYSLPKCFCSVCEVTGGFIMLLPCRRTHQGQEHLNKGEWQTWKELVTSFIAAAALNWLIGSKSFACVLLKVLIHYIFSFTIWQFLVLFWTKRWPHCVNRLQRIHIC